MIRSQIAKQSTEDSIDIQLGKAMEAYFAELERGHQPDLVEFQKRYPEVADQLHELLPGLEFLNAACADLKPTEKNGSDAIEPKATIGDYRIVRELGRGGMGVVFEAEQISLGRHVALKILPMAAMLDDKQLIRFRNEARAAATLDHPHVVQVLAVGCERGVHFYTMQLVEGRTLAEVIEQLRQQTDISEIPSTNHGKEDSFDSSHLSGFEPTQQLPAGEALTTAETTPQAALETKASHFSRDYYRGVAKIGMQAAEGLDHAHSRGIMHRDIKPGNLMLDHKGEVWITDFGLAHIEGDAGVTASGDLLGTIRYMSPEQALAKRVVVDHRSDIYSLGVTLYELLTLHPAYDETDRQALLRQIAFEEPKAPRRTFRSIPRELETIILKAMSKNPEERYATAQEMADDFSNYLGDRPIVARPPTLTQRSIKWSRRHQTFVRMGAILLVCLTVGLAISTALITQEKNAAQAAAESERQQKEEADRQRIEAERQRQIAQQNFQRARDAVDEYLTRVSEEELLNQPGMQPLRHDLLTLALKYYQEFAEERAEDPELRADLAQAFHSVGRISNELGDTDQSLESYEKALGIRRRLVADHPDGANYRKGLAATLNNFAFLQLNTGKMDEAIAGYQQAIEITKKLVEDNPDVLEYQSGLAMYLNNLASLQRNTGKMDEAIAGYQQAIEIRKKLVEDNPDVLEYQSGLAASLNSLANLQRNTGKLDEAIAGYQQAIEIRKKLVEESPEVRKGRNRLIVCLNGLGTSLSDAGKSDEANRAFQEAMEIGLKIPEVDRGPSDWGYLGQSFVAAEEWEEARQAFERGIELREETTPTLFQGPRWLQLSIALAHLGEMDKARENYLILKKQFDDETPRFNQHKEDLDELASLLGIEPEPDDDSNQPPSNTDIDKEEAVPM